MSPRPRPFPFLFSFSCDSRRERGIETGLGETFHSANRSPCVVGKVYNGLIYISRGYLPPSFLPFGRTRYFRSLILKLTRLGGVFLSLCLSLSLFLSLLFSFGQRRTRQYKPNTEYVRRAMRYDFVPRLPDVSFYYTTKRLFAPFYLFLRSYLFLTRNVPVPTRDLHHPPERSIFSLLNFIAHSRPIRSEAAF